MKEKEEKEERKRKAAETPLKPSTPASAAKNSVSGSRSSSRVKKTDPSESIVDLALESDDEDIVVVKKGTYLNRLSLTQIIPLKHLAS